MGVKDGLLALLARGPSYGYQLKSDFERATGGAWTLNIGQVYTSLQRLERDGMVTEVDGGEEDRRSYQLTALGREQLASWLAVPEERTVEDRDEVAMKVLLAASAPGQDPQRVIQVQRDTTMQALQHHTRRKARSSGPTLAEVVHLDRLILTCRAELDWLDLTEARLEARPDEVGSPGDPSGRPDADPTRTTTDRNDDMPHAAAQEGTR